MTIPSVAYADPETAWMDAELEDLSLTVHAPLTLSETPMFASEMGFGSITDLSTSPQKINSRIEKNSPLDELFFVSEYQANQF